MKRTTGKFDRRGDEIFEGDKVIKSWGWFNWNNEMQTRFQIHTITVRDAHKMANGQMHDDGGGIIFCVGKAYNFWEGKEVLKLTEEDVSKIGIDDDVDFFLDENEKGIRFTDQHFMGLSDEEWDKLKETRKKQWDDFIIKGITPHPGA